MSLPNGKDVATSKKNRAAISNGSSIFGPDIDHRTATARRAKDLIQDLEQQLGGEPSPAQKILIKNAAILASICEEDHRRFVAGEEVDSEAYLKRVTTLSGLLAKIGLKRLARDVSPKASGPTLDGHAALIRGR